MNDGMCGGRLEGRGKYLYQIPRQQALTPFQIPSYYLYHFSNFAQATSPDTKQQTREASRTESGSDFTSYLTD